MTFTVTRIKGRSLFAHWTGGLLQCSSSQSAHPSPTRPRNHRHTRFGDHLAHQARHRDHRRKSQLRSRLRHLRAEERRDVSTTCFPKASSSWTPTRTPIPGPNFSSRRNSCLPRIPTASCSTRRPRNFPTTFCLRRSSAVPAARMATFPAPSLSDRPSAFSGRVRGSFGNRIAG